MRYVVGTDEAGYGPNLGPLVISASVWEVPDGVRADDLYPLLEGVIAATPDARGGDAPRRVVIADSKVVYQPGRGLALLEQGVLAALALTGHSPASWRETWAALAPEAADALGALPWYAQYNEAVPVGVGSRQYAVRSTQWAVGSTQYAAGSAEQAAVRPRPSSFILHPSSFILSQALRQGLEAAGVRLAALHSRAIFEAEFNALVGQHGSKGTVLSHVALELASRVVAPLPRGPISIVCDKHGGRNAYRELLEQWFPDALVEICGEGRDESVYRFGPAQRRVEIRFRAKGERCLAAALASMASKYLRELAMRAVNAFWCKRVPGLAPTAGYPADARRFKQAIARAQAELGIEDRLVWRVK